MTTRVPASSARTVPAPSRSSAAARLGAPAFATAGVLFVLYPALRPWTDETSMDGAAAFASSAWIAAHLSAVLGFILLGLGLLVLRDTLRGTAADRTASTALALTWVGVGCTVLYFGAEIFGLHAIGLRAVRENNPALLQMVDTIRYNPAAITLFAAGLLLAAGAITAGMAIGRSGILPRWSGVPFAAGIALFLPQFFGTPALRIAHGVLLGIGCGWVALSMWRTRRRAARPTGAR